MNEKISAEAFRVSLDRSLSGLKADPRLAQSIIASEKGERKMKKKWSVSLLCALAVLLGLATVAYAVSGLYRAVTWQGEISRTVEPAQTPETPAEGTFPDQKMNEALLSFMADVPDEETVFAWLEDGNHEILCSELHKARKTFSSAEEFLRYMSGVQALTAPVWLPDGETEYYSAEVYMDCPASGTYELLENSRQGPIRYTRFLIGESGAAVTGYNLTFTLVDGRAFLIGSALRKASSSEEALLLREGETAEKVSVPGMSDALLIRAEDPNYPDGLLMRRKLDQPVRWKQLPYNDHLIPDGDNIYDEEYITVWAHHLENPEELLKLFSVEK